MSKPIFLLVLLSLSFCVLFSVVILCVILFSISKSSSSITESNRKTYHYQELDPNSNRTISGFVELNQNILEDEFITYPNRKTGSTIIISNFASSTYECSGICTCFSGKTENQRRHTSVLTRSLFLLFSAFSSTVAYEIAGKAFQDDCISEYSGICSDENIVSEVTRCSEKVEEDEDEYSASLGENEDDEEHAEYYCRGHCIRNGRIRNPVSYQAQSQYLEKIGGCSGLKTSAKIRVRRVKRNHLQVDSYYRMKTGETKLIPARYTAMNNIAKNEFSKNYLSSFCKTQSQTTFVVEHPGRRTKEKNLVACAAVGKTAHVGHYKSIKCSMTSERIRFQKKKYKKWI